tara:strand:+ start:178 stop:411 length:234 start_codon:yes stop_codon:yes gene_type:complete
MKIKSVGSNMTELQLKDAHVLFSYETPVAACIFGEGFVRTSQWYSQTTTRHINKWLDGVDAPEVPQSVIDALMIARG